MRLLRKKRTGLGCVHSVCQIEADNAHSTSPISGGKNKPKQGLMCSTSWIDRMPWCPNHKHAVEWCSSPGAITSHLSKSHSDVLACTIHAYIWSFLGPGLILPPTNTQRGVDRACKQIIQVEENSSFTGRLQRAGAKRVCETHKGVGEQDTR